MAESPTEVVRQVFEAFLASDRDALRTRVSSDLRWTYLDPSFEDPEPQTCYGRERLEEGMTRWAGMGLSSELEEVEGHGDKVLIVIHTPGLDNFRSRSADDRNFFVANVSDCSVTAIRAFKDRAEALQFAERDSE